MADEIGPASTRLVTNLPSGFAASRGATKARYASTAAAIAVVLPQVPNGPVRHLER